jgi:selenide, water dikinase
LSPVGLGEMLRALPRSAHPDVLVAFETSDDAAVYRLDDERALVLTVDVITPPVDDPRLFGQIAAANSLSDVYAMGGRPIACLSVLGFPSDKLGPEVLAEIVRGAVSKVEEAGAALVGGHTMEDEEPKFGLSVTGLVHPQKYWTNRGARAGDALVLTKPIGTGVLLNAHRKRRLPDEVLKACLESMTTLNRVAAEVLASFPVHAVTDVTGFGLAGHGIEMAEGSGVTLAIEVDRVPVLPGALAAYERGVTTGVNPANRRMIEGKARFERTLPAWHEEIFVDPQTSGGLLAAVPAGRADELVEALHAAGVTAAQRIGGASPYDGRHSLVLR